MPIMKTVNSRTGPPGIACLVLVVALFGLLGVTVVGQGFVTDGFGQISHFEDAAPLPADNDSRAVAAHSESDTPLGGAPSGQLDRELPAAEPGDIETGDEAGSGVTTSEQAFGSSFGSGSGPSFGDEAGPSSGFGQAQWSEPEGGSDPPEPFFLHDQLAKFLVLLGMSAVAVAVIVTGRFWLRKWVLLASIASLGFALGGFLCPLTAVQNAVLKWSSAYLLLFAVPVVLSLVLGRVFCGYVCPFGAVQEWLHVRRWSVRLPRRADRVLRWVKVGLLVYLIVRVVAVGTVILAGHTPFKPLFSWGGTPLTIALTVVTAAMSVILYRPFCAYGCPLGALLSLLSRVSLFRLERDDTLCATCGVCSRACVSAVCDAGDVDSADCLLCGACHDACPVSCLHIRRRRRTLGRSRSTRTRSS